MSEPRQPRTEAGRRLFTDLDPGDLLESDGVTWDDVIAIEEQAATEARRELLAALQSEVLALNDTLTAKASREYSRALSHVLRAIADHYA